MLLRYGVAVQRFMFFPLMAGFLLASLMGQPEVSLRLEQVTDGLVNPVAVVNAGDGSGRLFVVEIQGRIRLIEGGQLQSTPFLDITDRVARFDNGGLLGLAFHPAFAQNGRFFVNYIGRTSSGQLQTVIAEYRALSGEADRADPTERTLLTFARATAMHPGGDLSFGPDGQLYISSGDDGLLGNPESSGQNPGDLLGKILRIDVDQGEFYGIPTSNPFVNREGFRPEIWSLGFRNPFRMSFDSAGGRLFVGDVGESRREEINIVRRGRNYGWNRLEGTLCSPLFEDCDAQGFTAPAYEYDRKDGASVIGGRVYRGRITPAIYGSYVFADFISQRIWLLEETGRDTWRRSELLQIDFGTPAFGEDEEGELYLVDLQGGTLYRLQFSHRITFPVFASGTTQGVGFHTRLIASNPGPEASIVQTRVLDQRGREIAQSNMELEPILSHLEVDPDETVHINLLPETSFEMGWLDVAVSGAARVSLELVTEVQKNTQLSSTLVVPSPASNHFVGSMVWDPANQESTALALVNPNHRGALAEVTVRDSDSEIRGSFGVLLGPRFSSSRLLDPTHFGRNPFRGTVTIDSSWPIVAALFRTRQGLPVNQLELAYR